MVAKNQDFELVSGDSLTLEFTIKDTDNTAADLSFVTAIEWRASRLLSALSFETAAVITKTMALGSIVVLNPPTDGKCRLVLSGEDSASLYGRYYHELEITHPGDSKTTVTSGKMTVLKDLVVPPPPP